MHDMPYYVQKAMKLHDIEAMLKKPKELRHLSEPFLINEDKKFEKGEDIRIQTHPPLPGVHTGFHYHDFFEMIYVYRGSFMHTIHNETLRQTEDQVVLLNLGAVHSVWVESKDDIVFNIMMKKSVVENIFLQITSKDHPIYNFFLDSVFGINKLSSFIVLEMNQGISLILNKIIEEYYERKVYNRSIILAYLLVLFSELARKYRSDNNLVAPDHTKSSDILHYIKQNYASLTLESLADMFGYSRHHMGRLILSWTNKTFTDLITDYKIQSVCSLVQNTNLPISKIVEIAGFSDPSHFYKTFQKKMGIHFSTYRQHLN